MSACFIASDCGISALSYGIGRDSPKPTAVLPRPCPSDSLAPLQCLHHPQQSWVGLQPLGEAFSDPNSIRSLAPSPPVSFLSHHCSQDNIPDTVIKAIQPYIDSKEFQPAAISKVSKACTSICQWVRAMHKYHFVAKVVEPKRVRGSMVALGVRGCRATVLSV